MNGNNCIDEAAARAAKKANSFSDYVEGSATKGYGDTCEYARRVADEQKEKVAPMYHDKIDRLYESFCRRLAANTNDANRIDARVPSIMIAGGSKFPVAAKEKQNAARERNNAEWEDIMGLIDVIKSVGTGGISSDDPDAIEKLKAKLAEHTELQERMKNVNAYYRKNGTADNNPYLTPEQTAKLKAEMAAQWHVSANPFASFELSNNNAVIKRTQSRIDELERKAASGAPEGWTFAGGRVKIDTDINRLQIIFDEKPEAETIAELKAESFCWSPKNKAWQRQYTEMAMRAAKRIKAIAANRKEG